MHRTIFMTLLLLFSCMMAGAHRYETHNTPRHHRAKKAAYTRALLGSVGLGAIGGYITATNTLEYERFLNHHRLLSATLSATGYHGGDLSTGAISYDELRSKNYGCFIAPGMRFHPLGSRHRVDPGLGAAMAFGYGWRRDMFVPFHYNGTVEVVERHFFGAVLAELTVNFRSSRRAGLFSLFATGGYIYSNAKSRTYTAPSGAIAFSSNEPGYLQVGLRMGGAW